MGTIESTNIGLEYTCMKKISCRTLNLIYCIMCTRCKMQYVGQTLLRIKKDCFGAHFYSIEKPDTLQVVAMHFFTQATMVSWMLISVYWSTYGQIWTYGHLHKIYILFADIYCITFSNCKEKIICSN